MADVAILIVPATIELLDAAIEGDATLGAALDVEVAPGWEVFDGALLHSCDALRERPELSRWWTYFFVSTEPRVLVGWGGFKGPPSQDGEVELGYAVAPSQRGRGFATAAARALVERAFADARVQTVLAHTLAEHNASTLLAKLGFDREAELDDDEHGRIVRWSLARSASARSATD